MIRTRKPPKHRRVKEWSVVEAQELREKFIQLLKTYREGLPLIEDGQQIIKDLYKSFVDGDRKTARQRELKTLRKKKVKPVPLTEEESHERLKYLLLSLFPNYDGNSRMNEEGQMAIVYLFEEFVDHPPPEPRKKVPRAKAPKKDVGGQNGKLETNV